MKDELKLSPHKIDRNPEPTFGADPEFFIVTKKGTVLNSDRFFPSVKKKMKVRSGFDHAISGLFFDGIQAEFNMPYHTCREWLLDDIWYIFKKVHDVIGDDYNVSLSPCVKVRKDILAKADPRARIFGCEPDFDAYSGKTNKIIVDPEEHPLRYAGGHMHFGRVSLSHYFTSENVEVRKFVKLLDILVSIPLVLLERDPLAAERRYLYGRAGCYRHTRYGVEYRTPSSFWLAAPELTSFVFGQGRLAYIIMLCNAEDYFLKLVESNLVRYAIDYNDYDAAKQVYSTVKYNMAMASTEDTDPMCIEGTDDYYTMGILNGMAMFEWLVLNGINEVFGDPDLRIRWQLDIEEDEFEDHGDTAKGWFWGMYQKAYDEKDYRSFLKKKFKMEHANYL